MTVKPRGATIIAIRKEAPSPLAWLASGLLAGAALIGSVAMAFGESHETVIEAHAVANFGEPKYGPDTPHFDYVNPDAPKGGEFSTWALGGFDSFNNYTRKGVSVASVGVLWVDSGEYGGRRLRTYCYLCTTMEFPGGTG